MTGEIVGPDTPGLQKPEQRDLDREQRGLGEHGLVEQVGVLTRVGVPGGEDDVADGVGDVPGEILVEFAGCGVEGVREYRMGLVQLPAHAESLAALAGEQECQFARRGSGARDHVQRRPAAGQCAEAGQESVPVLGDHDRAVLEHGPGGGKREPDVDGRGSVCFRCFDERGQPCRLGAQHLGGPRGQHPRHRSDDGPLRFGHGLSLCLCRVVVCGGLLFVGDRGLFNDHVGVGAAHPEG